MDLTSFAAPPVEVTYGSNHRLISNEGVSIGQQDAIVVDGVSSLFSPNVCIDQGGTLTLEAHGGSIVNASKTSEIPIFRRGKLWHVRLDDVRDFTFEDPAVIHARAAAANLATSVVPSVDPILVATTEDLYCHAISGPPTSVFAHVAGVRKFHSSDVMTRFIEGHERGAHLNWKDMWSLEELRSHRGSNLSRSEAI
jgi:hypothetical protein